MKTHALSIPEIAFIAVTRGLAGAGLALLLSRFLTADARRTAGWTLLLTGAVTTIPIAVGLLSRRNRPELAD
jgi:hypothetical protein